MGDGLRLVITRAPEGNSNHEMGEEMEEGGTGSEPRRSAALRQEKKAAAEEHGKDKARQTDRERE